MSSSAFGNKPNECFISYGLASGAIATLLTEDATGGIRLVYSNGESCPTSPANNYSTVFLAQCGTTAKVLISSRSTDTTGCVITFAVSSAAFCGTMYRPIILPRALSVSSVIILVLLSTLLVYCISGATYKWKKLGARGLEAIPNIDFWRSCVHRLRVAIHFLTCGRVFPDVGNAGIDEYKDLNDDGPIASEPGII